MRRLSVAFVFLLFVGAIFAATDSLSAPKPQQKSFFKSVVHGVYDFVKDFSRVDTDYIEPQHYNFTVMVQNTNTYELYRLKTQNGLSVTFAPEPSIKLGPYLGWRWVFLGYTVDLIHLNNKDKTEFDLSFYTSQIGVDLFYRRTGNSYKIKNVYVGEEINTDVMQGLSFDGFYASITGFNLYYIFNHRKFSYPAAFSQSTVQRRSAGSILLGVGYTKHSLEMDWEKLDQLITEKLGHVPNRIKLDSTLQFGKVSYRDLSVSVGYGYNWAFAHNWLLAGSLSAGIGFKTTTGEMHGEKTSFRDFFFNSLNFDGVGRFGIVWNNTRWYVGASSILHTYNYRKSQFSTSNMFGNLNIYFGYNFGKR